MTIFAMTFTAFTGLSVSNADDTTREVEKLICDTQKSCEKLSRSIQAQITELEAKDHLSYDDKKLRYNLRKQLITAENQKQVDQINTIDEINKTDEKIAELRGALLYK